MNAQLDWFHKRLHLYVLALGLVALVVALTVDLPRSRGLYALIAAGPVIGALVTWARYRWAAGDRSMAKIVVECGWVSTSFGLGFLVMLPSRYYAVEPLQKGVLTLLALALVALGAYTLYNFAKRGYSLTP